jgi:hypothetical protein
VASVVWPQSAASVARGYRTRREGGAAPLCQSTRGAVSGEVTGQEEVGMLGERTSSGCPPGARRWAGSQSTDECG